MTKAVEVNRLYFISSFLLHTGTRPGKLRHKEEEEEEEREETNYM